MTFTTGAQPLGSLIIDGNTIYGMTELGGPDNDGFAFQIDNDGSNFTHLIDFDGDNGSLPFGSLIKVNGALFGMTNYGGANNTGVIFRYGEEIIEAVNDITKNNITISPNPNSGNFNITVDAADLQNDLKLEVINPLGQTILSQTITSTQTQIHLSQKIPGLYLIKCGSEISTVLVF
ncbi:MAG: T9SS type A sorting domain-containing protein [Bacteroidetes bacterium]|nr:T9SS type A sorting domain-containing protein [Bacteroidota bacterium]